MRPSCLPARAEGSTGNTTQLSNVRPLGVVAVQACLDINQHCLHLQSYQSQICHTAPLCSQPGLSNPENKRLLQAKYSNNAVRILQASDIPLFGELPSTVWLHLVKDHCDRQTQQAAYRSCKDIRNSCNLHMKSVLVQIRAADSLEEVQQISSKTQCPEGAYGIDRLTVQIFHYPEFDKGHVFAYLYELVRNSFTDTHNLCREQQLANVSCIEILVPKWFFMSKRQSGAIAHLLSQFPNLRRLLTNIRSPLSCISGPNLQQIDLCCPITHKQLALLCTGNPNIQNLLFSLSSGLELLPSCCMNSKLRELKALRHLSIVLQSRSWIPACVLVELTQLRSLALHYADISDAHLLTKLHITQPTLESVHIQQSGYQQLQPAQWPALKSVQFLPCWFPAIEETLARAILPLPHPDFGVVWPLHVRFYANAAPHPQFSYMAVAHMESLSHLYMTGQHIKPALEAVVSKRVAVKELHVNDNIDLGCDLEEQLLQIPTLRTIVRPARPYTQLPPSFSYSACDGDPVRRSAIIARRHSDTLCCDVDTHPWHCC